MSQTFSHWANKVPLYLAAGLAGGAMFAIAFVTYFFSPEFTDVGYRPQQPVPFSHRLHAGELELDCRYCHAQVEVAAVASVPPTKVCMNCHQLVKRDSPQLEAVLESMANDIPIQWVRVHKIPEYAYFDHSVHIGAGVGCSDCHGDIRQMEVVQQHASLSMSWCLECHRQPEMHLREPSEITNTTWQPPRNQMAFATALIERRGIDPPEDCSTCHR